MSQLHQLELAYNQVEDRLILNLRTNDFCEYLFWVTRFCAKILWDILLKLLQADQKSELQHRLESRRIAKQIEDEKKQRQETAEKLSHSISRRPLGDQPLLLIEISGKVDEKGITHLRLKNLKGSSIDCTCNSTTTIALCELLDQGVEKANWNLSLTFPYN